MNRIHFSRQQLRESLERIALREEVRKIVERVVMEEVGRTITNRILNEADSDEEKSDDDKNATKRKTVMKILQSPYIDCAQIAYQIWHPKDEAEKDRYRSEFSKKMNGTPDDDGTVREFTNEEIDAIYNIIQNQRLSR